MHTVLYMLPLLPSSLTSLRNFIQGPVNMYNCKDVTVSSSTFENNHAQSVFRDLPSRVSGGGLSITLYGSLNHLGKQGAFIHTIQSCTFSNNSANSIVTAADTTSILNDGYVNNRGGGVAFFVVNQSAVTITVSQCNFTNNSAQSFGGGLVIFSPQLVADANFTVVDNHFERNEANRGGGIALGSVIERTGQGGNLMKLVIFCGNRFERNKAEVGGAMFLGPG